MLAAPDLIIACPHCSALARIFQLAEANTLGAITWTDGWQDTPLMPRAPRLTRCQACHRAFWTAEAAPVGYYDPALSDPTKRPGWADAPMIEPLDEAGLRQALTEGLGETPDLELELRVAIWWRGNDRDRQQDSEAAVREPAQKSSAAIDNMQRIIEMCGEGEEDLLLFRAEAQRELGDFDGARRTLEGVCCSDYWPAKSRLLELIAAQDRQLRVMFA
jgi:hypothetical protein